MNQIVCDECGKEAPDQLHYYQAHTWFQGKIWARSLDLCSWECVIAYAKKQKAERDERIERKAGIGT